MSNSYASFKAPLSRPSSSFLALPPGVTSSSIRGWASVSSLDGRLLEAGLLGLTQDGLAKLGAELRCKQLLSRPGTSDSGT